MTESFAGLTLNSVTSRTKFYGKYFTSRIRLQSDGDLFRPPAIIRGRFVLFNFIQRILFLPHHRTMGQYKSSIHVFTTTSWRTHSLCHWRFCEVTTLSKASEFSKWSGVANIRGSLAVGRTGWSRYGVVRDVWKCTVPCNTYTVLDAFGKAKTLHRRWRSLFTDYHVIFALRPDVVVNIYKKFDAGELHEIISSLVCLEDHIYIYLILYINRCRLSGDIKPSLGCSLGMNIQDRRHYGKNQVAYRNWLLSMRLGRRSWSVLCQNIATSGIYHDILKINSATVAAVEAK